MRCKQKSAATKEGKKIEGPLALTPTLTTPDTTQTPTLHTPCPVFASSMEGEPAWLAAAGGKPSLPFSHFVPIYLNSTITLFPFLLVKAGQYAFFLFLSHCCLKTLLFSSFLPFFGEAF
jgi:hypothetical protein